MFGLSTAKLVIYGVIFAALVSMAGLIAYQHHENGALHERVATVTAERDRAVAINAENVVELAAIRLDAQRSIAAMAAELGAAQARAKRTQTIKQEIARVAATDDRPVGVVLGGLLDRLRAGAGPPGDKDRARPPGDPTGAAGVRP